MYKTSKTSKTSKKGGKKMSKKSRKGGKNNKTRRTSQKNPCWKGYRQVGVKMKSGNLVPNCIPI